MRRVLIRPDLTLMPRVGATIFGDLIGKLDVLHVACDECGREITSKSKMDRAKSF